MNFLTALLEQYTLLESLDTTIKANPHIPESIIRGYHANALPDNNKNDRLLNHVLKLHNNGNITPETAHLLKPHLTALSNTNQLHQLKNLNTLNDHINATKGIEDKSITKKERVDVNTPTVFENEHVIVKQHLTHESAVKGAILHPQNPAFNITREKGKAQWCVSADSEAGKNYYRDYTHNGVFPMYTITNKKTKRKTAMVASNNKYNENSDGFSATLEIRDEQDKLKSPYSLLVNNPGLEESPIGDFFVKNEQSAMRSLSALPHTASKDRISTVLQNNYSTSEHYNAILEHPNTTHDHIHDILYNPNTPTTLKIKALKHSDVHPDDINDLAHSGNIHLRNEALISNKLSDENIKWAIGHNQHTLLSVLLNSKLSENQLGKIIKENINNRTVLEQAMYNSNATTEHINTILDKGSDYQEAKRIAVRHKNAGSDEINKALDDEDDYVRGAALSNPKTDDKHITKAMSDREPWVVHKAMLNKAATKKHFLMGLNHPYEGVKEEAAIRLAELEK